MTPRTHFTCARCGHRKPTLGSTVRYILGLSRRVCAGCKSKETAA
jgi:hypothetical protein